MTQTAVLLLLAASATVAVLCVSAAPASATDGGSNWAGYVSTGQGTRFQSVGGTWVEPAVACTPGRPTYMSSWVGLGGDTSQALEQIGTEADCASDGKATYSSWFELYPTISGSPKLAIRPGDVVSAAVTVIAGKVRLDMTDETRGTRFIRVVVGKRLDVSSAEWIVEAPSVCATGDLASCHDSRLSDFGSTGFTAARASTAGHSGTVTGPGWTGTACTIATSVPSRSRAASTARGGSRAVPTALSRHADSFAVSFVGSAQ